MRDEYNNARISAVQSDFDRREAQCEEMDAEREKDAAQYIEDEIELIEFKSPQEAETAFNAAVEKLRAATKRLDELLEMMAKKQDEAIAFMKDNPVAGSLGAE